MSDAQWEEFIRWGALVAQHVKLEAEDRSYKRAMASELGASRAQFIAGDDPWRESLFGAVKGSNLIHRMSVSRMKRGAEAAPDLFAGAVRVLWTGEPRAAGLAEFRTRIRQAMELSPSNIPALGALLLMTQDPDTDSVGENVDRLFSRPTPSNCGARASWCADLVRGVSHLYGLDRNEIDHILEAWHALRREDEADHGEYRTRRPILAADDEQRQARRTDQFDTLLAVEAS